MTAAVQVHESSINIAFAVLDRHCLSGNSLSSAVAASHAYNILRAL